MGAKYTVVHLEVHIILLANVTSINSIKKKKKGHVVFYHITMLQVNLVLIVLKLCEPKKHVNEFHVGNMTQYY